jgi:hypothetical protein
MATIWRPDQPLARCSVCGVARQFHFASDVPRSADRDHEFVAETIDDFEPGDLTPEQLVYAIAGASGRVAACREELKARVRTVFGVTWDDLLGAVE